MRQPRLKNAIIIDFLLCSTLRIIHNLARKESLYLGFSKIIQEIGNE